MTRFNKLIWTLIFATSAVANGAIFLTRTISFNTPGGRRRQRLDRIVRGVS